MRIGIIAEGRADIAVITNVIKGLTGLDSSNLQHLRPTDEYDETDLQARGDVRQSTWSLVKAECEEKIAIKKFLSIEGNKYVAIHMDSAEAQDYDVKIPPRDENFCLTLRTSIKAKMRQWIGEEFNEEILYAIAVEEIDAWLLTIHRPKKDSSLSPNPKKALGRILSKKGENSTSNFPNYFRLSEDFARPRRLKELKCFDYNCSLMLFANEISDIWKKESQSINN